MYRYNDMLITIKFTSHLHQKFHLIQKQKHFYKTVSFFEIRMYFINNSLKINDSNTEIILIENPQKTSKIQNIYIKVGSEQIASLKLIRNLGIYFDTNYTFKTQINTLCKK